MVDGYIQQSWIVSDPVYDKSKYYGYNLPIGSWFIEVKIKDSKFFQEKVKDENRFSFSVEGMMGMSISDKFSSIDKMIDNLTDEEVLELFQDLKKKR
jgi:hypothetical protein